MAAPAKSAGEDSAATVAGAAKAAVDVEASGEIPAKAPGEMTKEARPTLATAAIFLMTGTGFLSLGLGVYFMIFGGSLLGGIIFLALGAGYASGGRALYKGESWGWGAGVFAGAFYFVFGFFLLPWAAIAMALAAVVIVLLIVVRGHFGVVRYDAAAEELKKTQLKEQRTRNPEGLHCPHCGNVSLWVAPDGSAYCDSCKTGTISIRPAP